MKNYITHLDLVFDGTPQFDKHLFACECRIESSAARYTPQLRDAGVVRKTTPCKKSELYRIFELSDSIELSNHIELYRII